MNKKIYIVILTLVIMLLSACSKNDEKVIKLGYWYNNSNEKQNNQLIIDEFKKLYPDYEIEMIYIPYNNFSEQVLSMAAAGNLPDVLWVRDMYLPMLAERGLLEDLEPYIEQDPEFDPDKYVYNALEYTKVNGIQYALPRDVGVQVMALNLDIFEEYKVPLPDPDWSWDDMINIGQSLTIKNGDNIEIYGLGWLDLECLVYSNGGKFFSDDGTIALFNEEKTAQAIQMYSDLINKYHISPTPSESQGLGNVFFGGKAAMAVVGPWDFATLNNVGINFDIVPFPKGPKGEGTMKLSGLPVAVTTQSKNKEIAYELVKFLTYSEKGQQMLVDYGIAMPSIESIATSEEFIESELMPESMELYFEALNNTTIIRHFDGEMEAMNAFSPYLDEIYLGDKTMSEIGDEIQEVIQNLLNEN